MHGELIGIIFSVCVCVCLSVCLFNQHYHCTIVLGTGRWAHIYVKLLHFHTECGIAFEIFLEGWIRRQQLCCISYYKYSDDAYVPVLLLLILLLLAETLSDKQIDPQSSTLVVYWISSYYSHFLRFMGGGGGLCLLFEHEYAKNQKHVSMYDQNKYTSKCTMLSLMLCFSEKHMFNLILIWRHDMILFEKVQICLNSIIGNELKVLKSVHWTRIGPGGSLRAKPMLPCVSGRF